VNYTDEESRLNFHKSKTLLQMVCQMFESFCFLHAVEPEFVDLIDEDRALMGVPDLFQEQAEDVVDKINTQFPRKDEFLTCRIMDPDLNLFEIFVTHSQDFTNVN